jgi:hypothetical protein
VTAGEFLIFEDRASDSPLVERVWRSRSVRAGTFLSVAESRCELVITRLRGRTFVTLRGPETRATPADCPADGEWLGIRLAPGTFFPAHPAATISDRRDVTLPSEDGRTFRLQGSTWELPDFENAETFVARLARAGVLAHDAAVRAVLGGDPLPLSQRSAQRHFLRATGLTHGAHQQIERARHATRLLDQGASIADAVHAAGYFDQAHLTRSVASLIGVTPARIRRKERQLSFLYKTGADRRE